MLRYRIFYVLALAAATLFYIFYSGYFSFFLLALLILLPMVSWAMTFSATRKTELRLEAVHSYAVKNQPLLLGITLKNRSIFPIAQVRLNFSCTNTLCGVKQQEVLFLPAGTGAEQTAEYRLTSNYCGKITAELTKITYYDYLGIFRISQTPALYTELYSAPAALYPDALIENSGSLGMESNTFSKVKPGDDPSEIFDIRPYRSGDRLRSIHWKLSSRLDELMVKEFSLPMDSTVLLLTELLAPDMDTLDTVVETLASVSAFLLENQILYSVGWYNDVQSQYFETQIENEEDQAVFLNALLSVRRYQSKAMALAAGEDGFSQKRPHLIYITGTLTDMLSNFCAAQADAGKITVLKCGVMDEAQQKIAAELEFMQVQILEIPVGTVRESLSGVTV